MRIRKPEGSAVTPGNTALQAGAFAVGRANTSLSGSCVAMAITPTRTTRFGSFMVQLPSQQKLVEHLLGTYSSCELT